MKSYLAVFFFLFCTLSAFSQFHFGVKAGVAISNIELNKDDFDETKSLTSFNAGLFARIKIANQLSLIPELQYIAKGYSPTFDPSSGIEPYKIRINYIELPVLINYQPIKWLSVEAGPGLGVKIVAQTISDSGKNDLVNDLVQSIDFGINGGLRFHPMEKLSLITRYNYGVSSIMSDVYSSGPSQQDKIVKAYNRSIQFAIAYQIK